MTSLFNKHRWMQVMWGILLAVAGIITIVFTATSSNGASESVLVLSVSIAIILFAYGFAILFTTFLTPGISATRWHTRSSSSR